VNTATKLLIGWILFFAAYGIWSASTADMFAVRVLGALTAAIQLGFLVAVIRRERRRRSP